MACEDRDIEPALEAHAAQCGLAMSSLVHLELFQPPALPGGPVTPDGIAAMLGALVPPDTVVVDESILVSRGYFPLTNTAVPHDWMNSMGAFLGYALSVAFAAALATPERKGIALVDDSSAMYTLQSLWIMARGRLDVTILILTNRSYNILHSELTKIGVRAPRRIALDMLTLADPDLDWVAFVKGHGVLAESAHDLNEFAVQLARGLAADGPYLIELVI